MIFFEKLIDSPNLFQAIELINQQGLEVNPIFTSEYLAAQYCITSDFFNYLGDDLLSIDAKLIFLFENGAKFFYKDALSIAVNYYHDNKPISKLKLVD